MVSSKAGTNLYLFVLVLQGMTSNILNNKGKEEVHRTPDRSMVSRERKTPSIQSSLHSSRQPC